MHACGHDFHTSVMLGAAHLLKAREAELPGTVRIFFQPAEETFNGARHLIDAGALDNVAAVFGLHNAPELPTGTFATRAGPFYANVDRFQILITGKGAHAAKPEQGVDTIVTASQIVGALQTLPSRSFSSLESLVVSVTRIEGGNTWNVLPQTVELEGTVRTHSDAVRRQVPDKIRQVIDGVAAALGAQAELHWQPGPPAVINDAHWAAFSKTVAAEAGYRVEEAELQMGVKISRCICITCRASSSASAPPASSACIIRVSIPMNAPCSRGTIFYAAGGTHAATAHYRARKSPQQRLNNVK